ncbi:hypothetical protein J2Y45_001168 [Dyadobacter sp. BE34]|uniref:Outer membrane protein beta-barrel domain-containing protein n=1 Tax=Dyadobacter fermentans TaxID=94254 RepID=A0ABU1QRW2_9BACT|nr:MULTISPECIES: hypothetical protein [Dyadobacter]MDR6803899.1 hypothetical protein [Dyadobacter fermentans]MDR7041639.1 hypothetical protein [Dyadobacter sp. BE242]MDR7196042.1 hypothetical protein [Dyadobacter sp. BE34]MDR7213413.1 hypothetical protein [Dyadobacter sp. BE31]MDR7261448.1 hypothetical protein [Dyadobacter sp. BE32]
MKNLIICLLTGAFVTAQSPALAQFKEGEKFISGSFYLNLFDNKVKDIDSQYRRYNHTIGVSMGKFKSNTMATGWGLSHSLAFQKLENFNIDPKPLQTLGFGIERFWEFYKPLNDKFALYVRPDAGLSYTLKNSFDVIDDRIARETQDNSFLLGFDISAGIAWRLAPKWVMYGSFAFSNPIYISYGFGKITHTVNPRPDGQYPQTNTRGFAYNFAPQLSSGSIGLGFRYFY